jgi:hypothetical protein
VVLEPRGMLSVAIAAASSIDNQLNSRMSMLLSDWRRLVEPFHCP